jgi:hypothetical protein
MENGGKTRRHAGQRILRSKWTDITLMGVTICCTSNAVPRFKKPHVDRDHQCCGTRHLSKRWELAGVSIYVCIFESVCQSLGAKRSLLPHQRTGQEPIRSVTPLTFKTKPTNEYANIPFHVTAEAAGQLLHSSELRSKQYNVESLWQQHWSYRYRSPGCRPTEFYQRSLAIAEHIQEIAGEVGRLDWVGWMKDLWQ